MERQVVIYGPTLEEVFKHEVAEDDSEFSTKIDWENGVPPEVMQSHYSWDYGLAILVTPQGIERSRKLTAKMRHNIETAISQNVSDGWLTAEDAIFAREYLFCAPRTYGEILIFGRIMQMFISMRMQVLDFLNTFGKHPD